MTATSALRVDSSNLEQLRAWDGGEGAYWAAHAEYFDRSVTSYHRDLMAAAAIGPDEHVLDVGCGTGQTTRDAARAAAAGSALGVDLSSRMIEYARGRAAEEGVTNARFEQADAQIHPFEPGRFDVAISRTGAMFFGDPEAAFSNIGRALRPGGRIVLLTWQPLPLNEWVRDFSGALAGGRDRPAPPPDAPSPFSLSEPDRVRAVLGAAGFTGVDLTGSSHGMWFGTDPDDAVRFVLGLLGWMLEGLGAGAREGAVDALRGNIAAHQTADGIVYASAAWMIRATRP